MIEAPIAYQYSHRANIVLARIAEWAALHKLTFSEEKILAIYFRKLRRLGRRRNPSTTPRMHFLGVSVKTKTSAVYLGIMVDANLNGMAHVAYVRESKARYATSIHSLSWRD